MKHIKEILAARREQLLSTTQTEKGSREWSAFNSVREDRVEMFPVSTPRMKEQPRYPNLVHISRFPRQLRVQN